MSTNIEIEVKVLLEKDDFTKVLEMMETEKSKRFTQTNHYIDTDDFALRRYGMALRIRETEDFILTLKTPLAEGLLEKNQSISWKEYEAFLARGVFPEGPIAHFVESLGIQVDRLRILTSLTTVRTVIHYRDGILSLDENTYDDAHDFELEMEANSIGDATNLLQEVCEHCQVPFVLNTRSKQARAMDIYHRRKQA